MIETSRNMNASADSKIRVAIADDHTIFREGVRALLSLESDIEVVEAASDGSEVEGVLARHSPDVLLLDLHMPGMSGIETLEHLENVEHSARVIVMTASEDQQEYIRAISSGAAAVILKQAAAENLIDCIRAVNSGEIWIDADGLPLPEDGPRLVLA